SHRVVPGQRAWLRIPAAAGGVPQAERGAALGAPARALQEKFVREIRERHIFHDFGRCARRSQYASIFGRPLALPQARVHRNIDPIMMSASVNCSPNSQGLSPSSRSTTSLTVSKSVQPRCGPVGCFKSASPMAGSTCEVEYTISER